MTTPLPDDPRPDYQPVAIIDRTADELVARLGVEFTAVSNKTNHGYRESNHYRLGPYTFRFRQPAQDVELGIMVLLDVNDDFNGRDNSVYRLFRALEIQDSEVFWIRDNYIPREYAHLC